MKPPVSKLSQSTTRNSMRCAWRMRRVARRPVRHSSQPPSLRLTALAVVSHTPSWEDVLVSERVIDALRARRVCVWQPAYLCSGGQLASHTPPTRRDASLPHTCCYTLCLLESRTVLVHYCSQE
ncbi:hypothetical protein E2C01_062973 [Portunus trituberculatus]|uniref:Uncharacterized protein n=1 Tax=Portunus trituberculatus TaxID=210409 RepID=A0A5B7HJJ4_PORTR|nr:hypothetical protein [Portunus trituberculatus]